MKIRFKEDEVAANITAHAAILNSQQVLIEHLQGATQQLVLDQQSILQYHHALRKEHDDLKAELSNYKLKAASTKAHQTTVIQELQNQLQILLLQLGLEWYTTPGEPEKVIPAVEPVTGLRKIKR